MNIRQVAKQARVSTATVSRVINGSAPVSEKTAERVRRTIEKLSFYPNTHARTLGSGKSRMYGLIISDITNPFFPELVKSFEDIAVEHGQEVIVANTDYQPKRMEMCVRRMLERKVDGVAIMTSEMEPGLADMLSHRGIPIVFLDTGTVSSRSSNIEVDYGGGIDRAIEHLASLGHTRIAFISGPMGLKSAQTRHEAFRSGMRRKGLPYVADLVRHGDHRTEGGRIAMRELLELKHRPTAVIGSNDLTAIGAVGAIHQAGLRVPEDISVVGCDDIELSNFIHPPLTTIRIPRNELATRAFTALFAVSQGGETGASYRIEPTLVLRQSTAMAQPKATRSKI
jgi:DNA-binding LacI/PurR family transcriptional regulator